MMKAEHSLLISFSVMFVLWFVGSFFYSNLASDTFFVDSTSVEASHDTKGKLFYNQQPLERSRFKKIFPVDPTYWPKFYSVLFILLPLFWALIAAVLTIDSDKSKMTFVDDDLSNVLVWVSVYFFCILPISSVFSCLQSFATVRSKFWLWGTFPIEFDKRLHVQIGFFGCLFLLLSSLPLLSNPDAEKRQDLIKICALIPAVCAIKFGIKGLRFFLDVLCLDGIGGMKTVLFLGHLMSGFFIFYWISMLNEAAGKFLLSFWIVLWILPNVFWISGSFSAIVLPQKISKPLAEGEEAEPQDDRIEDFQLDVEAPGAFGAGWAIPNQFLYGSVFEYHFEMVPSKLTLAGNSGNDHWMFSRNVWHLPMRFQVAESIREDFNKLGGVTVKKRTTACKNAPILQSSVADGPFCFATPFWVTVVLPNLLLHCFSCCWGSFPHSLVQKTNAKAPKELNVVITPPVGKSLQRYFDAFPDLIVMLIEPSGVETSLSYLTAFAKSKRESFDENPTKAFFLWRCQTVTEILAIALFLDVLQSSNSLSADFFEFAILYTGNLPSKGELEKSFTEAGLYDAKIVSLFTNDTDPKKLNERNALNVVHSVVIRKGLSLVDVNFELIFNHWNDEGREISKTLLLLGTSDFTYSSRQREFPEFDVVDYQVIEESLFNEPEQKNYCANFL